MTIAALDSYCTFCTKRAADVERLIAGAGVFICNECVVLCSELLTLPRSEPNSTMNADALSDEDILGLLPQVARVSAQVEDALNDWIRRLRARGVSWARIGAALGVTRQSAWERFAGEE